MGELLAKAKIEAIVMANYFVTGEKKPALGGQGGNKKATRRWRWSSIFRSQVQFLEFGKAVMAFVPVAAMLDEWLGH